MSRQDVRIDFGPATLRFRLWLACQVVCGRALTVDASLSTDASGVTP